MRTNTIHFSLLTGCHSVRLALLLLACCALLTGCGGTSSSGPSTVEQPNPALNDQTDDDTTPFVEYQRNDNPQPNDPDVRAFMTELWNNVARQDRCGACHDGSTEPRFARTDDVNLAYEAVQPYINRDSPQLSGLVAKATAGHNCWLGEANADSCGDIIQRWITNWLLESDGEVANLIVLEPPPDRPMTNVKVLDSQAPLAFSLGDGNLRSLLREHCGDCHNESAQFPQSPFLGSDSIDNAWEAARTRINIEDQGRELDEALSRLVVRLRSDFHNCWSDCESDAQRILDQIKRIANEIPTTAIDPDLRVSHGIQLRDGTIATSGGRYESRVIALWDFSEGSGFRAHDVSGIEPAMDLVLNGDISWIGGYGIDIRSGRAQASSESSRKLYNNILQTGEYTLEAWVAPANVTQEDAWIVSYSGNNDLRNLTLGQTLYNYNVYHRSSTTSNNGEPALNTADADERAQATLQHVVITFDQAEGRKLYVDGVPTGDAEPAEVGNLGNWDSSFALILGNEASGQRQWQGAIRFLAIHNQALKPDQVVQNFDAGVGQKYFLSFQISEHVDIDDCWKSYVVFEVSQFDSYSYLFNKPFFARLYAPEPINNEVLQFCTFPTAPIQSAYQFPLRDIRIGINGKVTDVGQAYQHIDVEIRSDLNEGEYQQINDQGTIIPLLNGPEDDLFFLAFGEINGNLGVFSEPGAVFPSQNLSFFSSNTFGIRLFNSINASFAHTTGISTTHPDVQQTFAQIEQQLPGTDRIDTFVATHQVAIAQLAITYCNALVDQEAAQPTDQRRFFSSVDFAEAAVTAFDTPDKRTAIYDPLINALIGSGLSQQPQSDQIKSNFDLLLDGYRGGSDDSKHTQGLLACGADCDADRTAIIVKSLCSAALGSAALLIQ